MAAFFQRRLGRVTRETLSVAGIDIDDVTGPFAANRIYLEALHTLTGRAVYASEASTGTALGAALLTGIRIDVPMHTITGTLDGLTDYALEWREKSGKA